MSFDKGTGSYKSCNGFDRIAYYLFIPEKTPKAILQIAHGMSEHFGRYSEFSGYLAQKGILVCGNDHLGHGRSVSRSEDLGYFGSENGWTHMVKDMYLLTKLIKESYPDIPYFLLGHSMGSLLARAYLPLYGDELTGVILMGTSGKNKKVKTAMPVLRIIRMLKGERHRSMFVYKLAFGSYNKSYPKGSSRLAWMSQDRQVLKAFREDPRCNFILTVAGFMDLLNVLEFVSGNQWARQVPKDLPVHLVSGDQDPVGDFGKGVHDVYKELMKEKVVNLSMKLYPNDRHELLNEPHKETVYQDLLHWIEKHI